MNAHNVETHTAQVALLETTRAPREVTRAEAWLLVARIPLDATFQLQPGRCGRKCPRCGQHGPYWHAYFVARGGGKGHSYIGSEASMLRVREAHRIVSGEIADERERVREVVAPLADMLARAYARPPHVAASSDAVVVPIVSLVRS